MFTIRGANALALQDTPPKVIVLPPTNGPTPALNKPVVVGPDGRIPEPPAEKTFLQK